MPPVRQVYRETPGATRPRDLYLSEEIAKDALYPGAIIAMQEERPVYYLAHPLASDERFSKTANMRHVLKVMEILMRENFMVVAPWHTQALVLDNEKPEDQEFGLTCDCEIVRKLGRIILTGHKVSNGMWRELQALPYGGHVYNMVGVKDNVLGFFAKSVL